MKKCKNCELIENGSIIKIDKNSKCVYCGRQVGMKNKETNENYECQWENCSGGRFCEKHSLENEPMTNPSLQEIDEQFDKEFLREDGLLDIGKYDTEIVKAFIHKVISERDEALRKEISDTITKAILDGQNQIHDLKSGNATPEEISKRMEMSYQFHFKNLVSSILSKE